MSHKISHRLRRPVLLLPGGVSVGAEGEACIIVALESTGGKLDILDDPLAGFKIAAGGVPSLPSLTPEE